MIDTSAEKLVPLSKAGRIVNPSRPPHNATLWRWCLAGVGGVKLESVKIGGTRFTSEQAVRRFIRALNEPNATPEPINTAALRAGEKLAAAGC